MAPLSSDLLGRSVLLVLGVLVFVSLWPRPALAEVSEVTGRAYGYSSSLSLFGEPPVETGPLPVVTLPPDGSTTPITETDADGESARHGPAIVVQATEMTVSTEGTTGPDGSVASSVSVAFGGGDERVSPFSADEVRSTCTASESAVTGSTTLDNASLVTSTDLDGQPADIVDLPAAPAPDTTFGGTIDDVGDTFRIVLNEQIREGDTITVNAVHLYLGQNEDGEPVEGVAEGEAIIGQSVCGITASGTSTEDALPEAATTETAADAVTTTTTGEGETTTTQASDAVAAADQADRGGGWMVPAIGGLAALGVLAALSLRRPRGRHRG